MLLFYVPLRKEKTLSTKQWHKDFFSLRTYYFISTKKEDFLTYLDREFILYHQVALSMPSRKHSEFDYNTESFYDLPEDI